MDQEIPVTGARAQFAELVNRVGYGKERIVLTRHGKPLVALVPAEQVEQLEKAEQLEQAEQVGADEGTAVVVDLTSRPGSAASSYDIAAKHDPGPRV